MGRGSLACIRYLLFAFTLVFVIFGILLVYTGFSTFISLNKYELVINNGPDKATIALLVIGFAIFFTAFMGCCGAITGNDFMLRTFSFIITVLLIIEIVSAGFVFAFRKTIHESMEIGIEKAISKYNDTDTDSAVTNMIDDIQSHFHCCGGAGPLDWRNNTMYQDDLLPKSCCDKEAKFSNSTVECSTTSRFVFKDGCVNIISDELKGSVNFLYWVVITAIVIQIICILFGCLLTGSRREYSYV